MKTRIKLDNGYIEIGTHANTVTIGLLDRDGKLRASDTANGPTADTVGLNLKQAAKLTGQV